MRLFWPCCANLNIRLVYTRFCASGNIIECKHSVYSVFTLEKKLFFCMWSQISYSYSSNCWFPQYVISYVKGHHHNKKITHGTPPISMGNFKNPFVWGLCISNMQLLTRSPTPAHNPLLAGRVHFF